MSETKPAKRHFGFSYTLKWDVKDEYMMAEDTDDACDKATAFMQEVMEHTGVEPHEIFWLDPPPKLQPKVYRLELHLPNTRTAFVRAYSEAQLDLITDEQLMKLYDEGTDIVEVPPSVEDVDDTDYYGKTFDWADVNLDLTLETT